MHHFDYSIFWFSLLSETQLSTVQRIIQLSYYMNYMMNFVQTVYNLIKFCKFSQHNIKRKSYNYLHEFQYHKLSIQDEW